MLGKTIVLNDDCIQIDQPGCVKFMSEIIMRCLKRGCPRVRKFVPDPQQIPWHVAEIHSYCPWHEPQGAKAYPEIFYDAKGRELDGHTFKRI